MQDDIMETLVKQVVVVCILFGLTLSGLIFFFHPAFQKESQKIVSPLTKTKKSLNFVSSQVAAEPSQLFIPYWALSGGEVNAQDYSKLIYFGITGGINGIDTQDDSYKNIETFLQKTESNKDSIITVQMLDQDANETVLQDQSLQNKIILNSIRIAKQNEFKGILLDFEFSALNFASITQQINNFIQTFSGQVHASNLQFFIAAYGDTFYRARALDIATLAKSVDGVYVMAYDFHKSNGNPGPNFPYQLKNDEDYDFKIAADDFLKRASAQKLIFVLGLFGYDWTVGDKGQSLGQADPISFIVANKKFLQGCTFSKCKVEKDPVSKEIEVLYTDTNGSKHDVWLETPESANIKKEYLSSQGIAKTAIWAYSYF